MVAVLQNIQDQIDRYLRLATAVVDREVEVILRQMIAELETELEGLAEPSTPPRLQ